MSRPRITHTRTNAVLTVSRQTFDEIARKLRKADYAHAFEDDGTIDMHGIALARDPSDDGLDDEVST